MTYRTEPRQRRWGPGRRPLPILRLPHQRGRWKEPRPRGANMEVVPGASPPSSVPRLRESTLIRCFNRMNDLIPGTQASRTSSTTAMTSRVRRGSVVVRRQVACLAVAQPLPKPSTTLAYGARVNGDKADLRTRGAQPAAAALWTTSRTETQDAALPLSGGQQQRLCIARAIAVSPTSC